jgi:CheY-like chemotaxis protein/two-component sensor histidine kinase
VAAKLAELESHIQSAAQLTRQLLLFSRPESTRQEMLDLNRVVRDTVVLLVRLLRENIELDFEPDPQPLALEADRGQVEQIVMNLALNASDAMPDGGRLAIRTGRGEHDTVWLEVEDSGTGIPDDVREHLFEPFFTTKERSRGTGLGLSVVHGIVTLHRGAIDIDSREGEGTVFRVSLPAADPALLPEADSEVTVTSFAGDGERILVVEDDPAVRESLHEILTELGYRVTSLTGRQQVEEIPADAEYDLLLTDFGLPDGTGTEIAALLQCRLPRLRVIIMSGYAEDDVIVRRMMSGDLHFLQKPFSVQTLGRALRSVLGK